MQQRKYIFQSPDAELHIEHLYTVHRTSRIGNSR